MERVSKKSLIERFNGKIPDGAHYTAKNLEDFLETIENHTLTKHKEIILVEFQNPIKAKVCGMDGLGYFFNESHNKNDFYQIHNSLVEKGAQALRLQDHTIETSIPMYGHQDIFQENLGNLNGCEFIIQKPTLYFLSILEIGTGIISDNNINIGENKYN